MSRLFFIFAEKGRFQNSNDYFAQNPIDWQEYSSIVMNYGVYEGKRYLICL